MNFWEKIARGHIRLNEFEDRTIWRMRAAGESWDAIEERINALRRLASEASFAFAMRLSLRTRRAALRRIA